MTWKSQIKKASSKEDISEDIADIIDTIEDKIMGKTYNLGLDEVDRYLSSAVTELEEAREILSDSEVNKADDWKYDFKDEYKRVKDAVNNFTGVYSDLSELLNMFGRKDKIGFKTLNKINDLSSDVSDMYREFEQEMGRLKELIDESE